MNDFPMTYLFNAEVTCENLFNMHDIDNKI